MKYIKRIIKKFCLLFVFFVMGGVLFPFNVQADTINELNKDTYTDSDEFEYNSKIYDISQYSTELYNTGGGFEIKGGLYKPEWIKKGDDPIVKIIPKYLFSREIAETYIGQEYGFYIKTEKVEMLNDDFGDLYNSTVFVFDIETEITSQIKVTIKPIFQYKYITMIGKGSFKIDNVEFAFGIVDEVIEEPWVIAKPQSIDIYTHEVKYGMCDEYALKDISFEANLANEENIDSFDDGYNPNNDYGYFFTGFDYGFNGHSIEDGDINEDYFRFFADNISFFIGGLDIPILSQISTIYGDATTIYDNYIWLKNDTPKPKLIINSVDKEITVEKFPENRIDQIDWCKTELNKEKLIKSVILRVNENDSDIYYSVNKSFLAQFYMNHFATKDEEREYTRFTNNLFLKICDSKTKKEVSIGKGSIINYIGNHKEKELKMYKEENIYLLPNGENLFYFVPKFSGYYDINISFDSFISVLIDNKEYYGHDISINKYIEKNEKIEIKVFKADSRLIGKINISLSNKNDILIKSKDNLLLCLDDNIKGLRKISTNDKNILIDKLLYLDSENKLKEISDIHSDYNLTYFFNEKFNYFVLLKNESKQDILSPTISEYEVDTLNIEIKNSLIKEKNKTYFAIKVDDSSQYIFTFNKNNVDGEIYQLVGYEMKLIKFKNQFSFGFEISLDKDQKYYYRMGLIEYERVELTIIKSEIAYQWEITGGEYSSFRTFSNVIDLKTGYTYYFKFLVNDIVIDVCFKKNVRNVKVGKNNTRLSSEGKLTIPFDDSLGGDGIEIIAIDKATDKAFEHSIFVIPSLNEKEISISSFSDEELGFELIVPMYIYKVNYYIEYNFKKVYSSVYNDDYSNKHMLRENILEEYYKIKSNLNVGNININVYEVVIKNSLGIDETYNCSFHCSVNNLFASGSGDINSPFLISSSRHFKNIKYTANETYCYKLTKDIDISNYSDWVGISEFHGVLDGDNHSVTGCEYTIESQQFYPPYNLPFETNFGLFRKNYGEIKNLRFSDFGIKSNIAYDENRNLIVEASRIVNIGIICGINYGKIENCNCESEKGINFMLKVANAGAIAGTNSGEINKCNVYFLKIDCYGSTGLIAGDNTAVGIIYDCASYGNIICHYYDINQEEQYSTGGIVGKNQGRVRCCKNYAIVEFFLNEECDSRILQPRMGTIIGTNSKNGIFDNCSSYTKVNTKNLKDISWKEGKLWWAKTYHHNQKEYCEGIVGENQK